MQHQTVPQSTIEQPHDWHFTFGARQRFDGHFVTIHGTELEARAEMIRHFGNAWCAMYDATRPAEVTKFPAGLTNLTRAEWPEPARPTILTFNAFGIEAFGIEPTCLDTPATAAEIFEAIGDELTSAGYDVDAITLQFTSGGHAVEVIDDGALIGTVTISQPEPDYWLTLAADLRQAADRIATLAGTPGRVDYPRITLAVSVNRDESANSTPVIDAIASIFGTPAGTKQFSDATWHHSCETKVGEANVWAYAVVPAPEDAEKAAMQARIAELEARLAEGGAK